MAAAPRAPQSKQRATKKAATDSAAEEPVVTKPTTSRSRKPAATASPAKSPPARRSPAKAAAATPEPTVDVAPPAPAPAERKKRGPYNVAKLNKRPQTFRLPEDVFDLISAAQAAAVARGDKLSNDDAVIMAIRGFWGGRRRRRS